jgi:hypothetical protein
MQGIEMRRGARGVSTADLGMIVNRNRRGAAVRVLRKGPADRGAATKGRGSVLPMGVDQTGIDPRVRLVTKAAGAP